MIPKSIVNLELENPQRLRDFRRKNTIITNTTNSNCKSVKQAECTVSNANCRNLNTIILPNIITPTLKKLNSTTARNPSIKINQSNNNKYLNFYSNKPNIKPDVNTLIKNNLNELNDERLSLNTNVLVNNFNILNKPNGLANANISTNNISANNAINISKHSIEKYKTVKCSLNLKGSKRLFCE